MLDGQQLFALITGITGGLALFLFGMNVLSSSLTQFAGGKFEELLGKVTDNRFLGWLFGFVSTAIVQSSSATTVIIVGLVNSGIMKLSQAVNLVIGANLGTTATAWILSLNSLESSSFLLNLLKPANITPYLAIIGVGIQMFAGSERKKNIGAVIIGFSTMMIGMNMMSGAVTPLRDIPEFQNMLTDFSVPALGFLTSVLFTMIIQSSDATIGILQALAMSLGVNFQLAVVIICGAQIGTCITAILSSVGTGRNGKRTALMHLYYNLIKNVPFITILLTLNSMMHFDFMKMQVGAVGIAIFHSLINVVFSIIMVPVSGVLVRLALKTVPLSEDEKREQENTLRYLDPILLRDPALATVQVRKAVNAIAESVQEAFGAYLEGDAGRTAESCERAAMFQKQTITYIMQITSRTMMDEDSRRLSFLRAACGDFSDIGEQITGLMEIREKNPDLTEVEKNDLKTLGSAVQETLDVVVSGFAVQSRDVAETVRGFREAVNGLYADMNARQIKRMHSGEITRETGFPFMESCFIYVRILDRCDFIAGSLLSFLDAESGNSGRGKAGKRRSLQKGIRELFRDKKQ